MAGHHPYEAYPPAERFMEEIERITNPFFKADTDQRRALSTKETVEAGWELFHLCLAYAIGLSKNKNKIKGAMVPKPNSRPDYCYQQKLSIIADAGGRSLMDIINKDSRLRRTFNESRRQRDIDDFLGYKGETRLPILQQSLADGYFLDLQLTGKEDQQMLIKYIKLLFPKKRRNQSNSL